MVFICVEANFDKVNLVGAKGTVLINCMHAQVSLTLLESNSSGVVISMQSRKQFHITRQGI